MAKKKILIIDDMPAYVNSLKNYLSMWFNIETAYSLKEAKEKSTPDIDAFLVDIRLDESDPDNADGILFLEWIKEKYPEKPVILMSAYDEYEKRKEEILNKGASEFLKKPITLSDLTEKLNRLTKKREEK